MDVSIAICTFNRIDFLRSCIDGFIRLNTEKIRVIVVDNNCTDGTSTLITELQKEHNWIDYVLETKKGLSHARNKAIEVCDTTFLFYIDDDAVPEDTYFDQLKILLTNWKFDAVGGSEIRVYDGSVPNWYKELNQRTEAKKTMYMESGYVDGFNMGFKLTTLKAVGGFDPRVGMTGKKIAYGEETLISRQIRELGGELLFYPKLKVHHHIRAEKMTKKRYLLNEFAQGRDSWVTFGRSGNLRDLAYIIYSLFIGSAVNFFRSMFKLLSGKISVSLFFVLCFKHPAYDLGRISGYSS